MILYEAFICNIFLLPKIRMDKKVAIQQTFTITNIWKWLFDVKASKASEHLFHHIIKLMENSMGHIKELVILIAATITTRFNYYFIILLRKIEVLHPVSIVITFLTVLINSPQKILFNIPRTGEIVRKISVSNSNESQGTKQLSSRCKVTLHITPQKWDWNRSSEWSRF